MLGIGLGELIIILIIALIAVDLEKLPEIAKAAARVVREFKKAAYEFKGMIRDIDLDAKAPKKGYPTQKDNAQTEKKEGGGEG
ncbi:MAG: twin-arginine translocase TatA/TatE family subunit [Deltaproteobacteria bacterium]|nr:twin-arginine translocase TatA/TatE family subunit [Deltaproteobacteria bacterium]